MILCRKPGVGSYADLPRSSACRTGSGSILENQDGAKSLPIAVRATEAIRSDCAYMVPRLRSPGPGSNQGVQEGRFRYAIDNASGHRPHHGRDGDALEFRPRPVGRRGEELAYASFCNGHRPGTLRRLPVLHGGMQVRVGCPQRLRANTSAPDWRVGSFPKLTTSFYVSQCNHCDRPDLCAACPTGATYQDKTGIVRVNRDLLHWMWGLRRRLSLWRALRQCQDRQGWISATSAPAAWKTVCNQHVSLPARPTPRSLATWKIHRAKRSNLSIDKAQHRVETTQVAIGPNVYYAGKPEHTELLMAGFASPVAAHDCSGKNLGSLLNKFVFLAVGATFLGQAVAFFRQLSVGEKQFED